MIQLSIACMCVQSLSPIQLFATPWTVARLGPLSMRFSRQEYWSGLPFCPPGGLPNPGIKPVSPVSSALAGGFLTTEPQGMLYIHIYYTCIYIIYVIYIMYNIILLYIYTFFFRLFSIIVYHRILDTVLCAIQ